MPQWKLHRVGILHFAAENLELIAMWPTNLAHEEGLQGVT